MKLKIGLPKTEVNNKFTKEENCDSGSETEKYELHTLYSNQSQMVDGMATG